MSMRTFNDVKLYVTWTAQTSILQPSTGENLSTVVGKISKWYDVLGKINLSTASVKSYILATTTSPSTGGYVSGVATRKLCLDGSQNLVSNEKFVALDSSNTYKTEVTSYGINISTLYGARSSYVRAIAFNQYTTDITIGAYGVLLNPDDTINHYFIGESSSNPLLLLTSDVMRFGINSFKKIHSDGITTGETLNNYGSEAGYVCVAHFVFDTSATGAISGELIELKVTGPTTTGKSATSTLFISFSGTTSSIVANSYTYIGQTRNMNLIIGDANNIWEVWVEKNTATDSSTCAIDCVLPDTLKDKVTMSLIYTSFKNTATYTAWLEEKTLSYAAFTFTLDQHYSVGVGEASYAEYTNGIAVATCNSAATATDKVATVINGVNFQYKNGAIIYVLFYKNNTTQSSKTLNVNSLGAKNIVYWNGSGYTNVTATNMGYELSGECLFMYVINGSNEYFMLIRKKTVNATGLSASTTPYYQIMCGTTSTSVTHLANSYLHMTNSVYVSPFYGIKTNYIHISTTQQLETTTLTTSGTAEVAGGIGCYSSILIKFKNFQHISGSYIPFQVVVPYKHVAENCKTAATAYPIYAPVVQTNLTSPYGIAIYANGSSSFGKVINFTTTFADGTMTCANIGDIEIYAVP